MKETHDFQIFRGREMDIYIYFNPTTALLTHFEIFGGSFKLQICTSVPSEKLSTPVSQILQYLFQEISGILISGYSERNPIGISDICT